MDVRRRGACVSHDKSREAWRRKGREVEHGRWSGDRGPGMLPIQSAGVNCRVLGQSMTRDPRRWAA